MGLSIAIAGSISVAVVFMVITVIPETSDKLVEIIDARTKINKIGTDLDRTNIQISNIIADSDTDTIKFTVTNTGTEKLWNYKKFYTIVEYDADVLGVSTRMIETLTYNASASFPPALPIYFARPTQDISVGTWTTAPLYEKVDEVTADDIDFISDSFVVQNSTLKSPSATGQDYTQWTDPTFAYSSDNNHAIGFVNGLQQDYFNFDFNLPENALIQGIEVRLEGRRTGTGSGNSIVELSWNGGPPSYTTAGKTASWTASGDVIIILGGSTDNWGRTWSQSEFDDSKFRLRVTKGGDITATTDIDHIQVVVYFTPQITSTAEVKLSSLSDPRQSIGHNIKFRESGKLNRILNVTLVQGSNPIGFKTFSSNDAFQTKIFTLTPNQADSIADYSDLRIRWNFTDNGGSGDADVSWMEFEILGTTFQGSVSEWAINGANEDFLDPKILNPGESYEFGARLKYPIFSNGVVKVSVITDNGKAVSDSITAS